eukprot:EG_transcript_3968
MPLCPEMIGRRPQRREKPKWQLDPLEFSTPSLTKDASWTHLHGLDASPARASERLQHCHFMTFLASSFTFRHPLSADTKVGEATGMVAKCLRKGGASSIWVWLLLAIKRFARLQMGLLRAHQKMRLRRDSTLNRWLQFWQENEAKVRQKIRHTGASLDLSPASKSRRALVHAMAMTPDRLKVEILWTLYWLLWAEVSHRSVVYWAEWLPLVHFRGRVAAEQGMGLYNPNPNPRSLLEANAAFFIKALQAPKFDFVAGRDFSFKDLLRFASPVPDHYPDIPPEAPPYFAAFLTSSLCGDPEWMIERCRRPSPLVPPCTWTPPIIIPVPACRPFLSSSSSSELLEPRQDSMQLAPLLLALPPCTNTTNGRRRLNSCTPNPQQQRGPSHLQCPSLPSPRDPLKRRKSDSPYTDRKRSPSMLSPRLT